MRCLGSRVRYISIVGSAQGLPLFISFRRYAFCAISTALAMDRGRALRSTICTDGRPLYCRLGVFIGSCSRASHSATDPSGRDGNTGQGDRHLPGGNRNGAHTNTPVAQLGACNPYTASRGLCFYFTSSCQATRSPRPVRVCHRSRPARGLLG